MQSQAHQKEWYDRSARTRTFEPGENILLLLPTSEHKLLAKWQGPYQIKRRVGPVTYEIEIPSRTPPLHIFHVNMLKKWYARSTQPDPTSDEVTETATALFVRSVEGEEEMEEQYLPGRQGNSSLSIWKMDRGRNFYCAFQHNSLWKRLAGQM